MDKREPIAMIVLMDRMFFIRNAYVFVKHIVPFSIASLALLILSIPEDNLLARLAGLLKDPGAIYLPAVLLTGGATAIYFFTMRSLSARMYLWPKWDVIRTLITAASCVAICTAMAHWVLLSTGGAAPGHGDLWACYLVAVLSLTGVGWSGLGDWAESVGIRCPDYISGRLSAERIADQLKTIRRKRIGEDTDIIEFLAALEKLYGNIQENMDKEPVWARSRLMSASEGLIALIMGVKASFPLTDGQAVKDFAAACNYQKEFEYQDVVAGLKRMDAFWKDWGL